MPNQVVLFNAPGPQGPPGPKGQKGDTGPQGPAGTTLTVSGTGFVHWSGTAADPMARAVNLASSDVTGALPVADLAGGSNGQILTTSGTTPIWAASSGFISGGVTPGTPGQVYITNSSTVASWTSLVSVELTHGRFTAGGSGSDYKAVSGPMTGFETSYGAFWILPGATAPVLTNPAIYGDGSSTYFNAPSASGSIYFVAAGSTISAKLDFNNKRFYAGGGDGTAAFFVDWATANQTQVLAGSGQASMLVGTTSQSSASVKVASFTALNVDAAPGNITLQAQAPYASATVNTVGGDVIVNTPGSVGSGGKYGGFVVEYNSVVCTRFGSYNNGSYGAIWFQDGGSPNFANFAFLGNSADTYFNAPSGNMYFGIGANYIAQFSATHVNIGSFYFNPEYVLDLSPTAVLHFTANATTAQIKYDQSTIGAGAAFTIAGQAAKTSSGANGGDLNLYPGAGDGIGTSGNVHIGDATGGSNIVIGANGVQLFSGTASFGGGTGVLGIHGASVTPTSNPTGGGILWVDPTSGALKYRNPAGNVTTVAT